MNCPSCSTPLEPAARFCGVCGHRLQSNLVGVGAGPAAGATGKAAPGPKLGAIPAKAGVGVLDTLYSPGGAAPPRVATPASALPRAAIAPSASPRGKPGIAGAIGAAPRGPARPSTDVFLGQTLNGRFRIDSKIGEGGFGAVYRGLQLATGRKVALKLLHPEMTNDDNLAARFRREGLVLCNLRDAHTITTYDFDQTPDGTLYIAMELLEGRSLHQVFHDEAPVDWRRMFKILTEMCSSLAEAHAQGIVHRDLKPENIYLENRPGNPEFVKILDFGIAKVMRGEGSMDPQAPQLTATGQTLGTLEYMSPEQLMGKQLDGRSDVYALGVLAYELITGRLPFPEAKGPAGLITAQLKQTPKPPSVAKAGGGIPAAVDRVLLKCLEKDRANRHADVTALATAAREVLSAGGPAPYRPGADVLETRKGEAMHLAPPPAMPAAMPLASSPDPGRPIARDPTPPPLQRGFGPAPYPHGGDGPGDPHAPGYAPGNPAPVPQHAPSTGPWPPAGQAPQSSRWVWVAFGLLVLGAVSGAVLAYVL